MWLVDRNSMPFGLFTRLDFIKIFGIRKLSVPGYCVALIVMICTVALIQYQHVDGWTDGQPVMGP